MSREELLLIKDLSYSYEPDRPVLDSVSLTLYRGERIAVIGSNGAGKSTFFLSMNGVLTPDAGQIFLKGSRIEKKNLNDLRKNVGIVFQDAESQIVAATVRSEVSFGPMNLRLPKEEVRERTEEALAYMGLEEFSTRPPHYLSGGEKKRVTIAGVMAMKPEIMIFDEPAASLDPLGQQALDGVFDRLHGEGKTLLISTHDMDFAYRFADRVLVFAKGKIIADDNPVNIFKNNEILKEAGLKQPVLFEIYEQLVKSGKIDKQERYPKNKEDLLNLLK